MNRERPTKGGSRGIWARLASYAETAAKGTHASDFDPERGQAITRIVLVPLFAAYVVPVMLRYFPDSALTVPTCAFALLYAPVSWFILYDVVKRPGHKPWRRVLGMGGDYSSMTLAMVAGGAYTVVVYATLLWVTVGNGIRFGGKYLLAATLCALLALTLATIFNDYWQSEPSMVIALYMTTLMVPAYIFVLLKRLQVLHEAAVEANIAKSRFLAQASHDLRQPIHAISLFISCLRDAGLGREERQMVESIDRSLHSVARLFRSLLDISTLDSGKVEPSVAPVAVGGLLTDLGHQNAQAAEWANVQLTVMPCNCYVMTDDVLLTTMIQNVVTNALKYAPDGRVLVGCRRQGNKLAIEIHDSGPGIAEEHQARVFDEFYQVRERGDRDIEGVGLGLPIVRRMAGLLGLSVTLRSTPGKGTAIIIGGLAVVDPPRMSWRRRPAAAVPSTATHGLRVLLVEDDAEVLHATAALLGRWGCIVQAETAPPGTPGAWDVVVTDFDLGGKRTGSDCIALVRRMARQHIPAIVLTGHDEGRVRAELQDGNIPVLSKPVRPAELRSVLSSVVVAAAKAPSNAQ